MPMTYLENEDTDNDQRYSTPGLPEEHVVPEFCPVVFDMGHCCDGYEGKNESLKQFIDSADQYDD